MLLKSPSMPCKLVRLSSVLPPAFWEVVRPSNGSCEVEAMLAGRAEIVSGIRSWRTGGVWGGTGLGDSAQDTE